MRLFFRLRVFLFVLMALLAGNRSIAQIAPSPASHDEVEELRQTVRELAGRVSALEAELNRQKTGAVVETASLKPAVLALPAANIRSSVESVSSSGVAPAQQTVATQSS